MRLERAVLPTILTTHHVACTDHVFDSSQDHLSPRKLGDPSHITFNKKG